MRGNLLTCFVYQGMDKTTLARLLTGLALSSSWGCFDEFNRLEEKTLSGVAQELASILGAIGSGDANKIATLNGTEVTFLKSLFPKTIVNQILGFYVKIWNNRMVCMRRYIEVNEARSVCQDKITAYPCKKMAYITVIL